MTAWRDAQEAADQLRQKRKWQPVRVLGIDGDYGRSAGRDQPLTALEQLFHLLIHLSEHWTIYRVFDWQPDVPWTNNGTEQVIGRMKMRSRTVRGYKVWEGMEASLMLAGSGTF